MPLTVTLNGQQREFASLQDGATLTDLVVDMGFKADRVAVERNGGIVARKEWGEVRIGSGDKLEIVHFVGGGLSLGSDKAM